MVKKKSYLMPLILIILSLLIIAVIPSYSVAKPLGSKPTEVQMEGDGGDGIGGFSSTLGVLDGYDPSKSPADIGEDEIVKKANTIIFVIKVIGAFISVVTLLVLGIKYMLGSIEEKAEYKKTMIPYLVGATMVFAIPQLVQVIYDIATSAF